MIEKLLEALEYALKNNELKEFLMGEGRYFIPCRVSTMTDFAVHLEIGIYYYYERHPESKINIAFEQALIEMFDGDNFTFMCGFMHYCRQKYLESINDAPFKLCMECMLHFKDSLAKKQESLKVYKEYWEFGSDLENGAYEYIENSLSSFEEK